MQKLKMVDKKWRTNNFWETTPDDSADTLGVKIFAKITLSRTDSEINAFLHFTPEFKLPVHSAYTMGENNFIKIALPRIVYFIINMSAILNQIIPKLNDFKTSI